MTCAIYACVTLSFSVNFSRYLTAKPKRVWPCSNFTQKQVFGPRTAKSQPHK